MSNELVYGDVFAISKEDELIIEEYLKEAEERLGMKLSELVFEVEEVLPY